MKSVHECNENIANEDDRRKEKGEKKNTTRGLWLN